MYNAIELKNLKIKPNINDISLDVLREFYELLFYSTYDNAEIHLGVDKDYEGTYYFPRTFFVEKLGKMGDKNIYVDNQEQIVVTKENSIIMI